MLTSAYEFLVEVRALVEPLPRDPAVCELCELALNEHNQEMLDICLSHDEQPVRVAAVVASRHKLIERLEDLHEHGNPEVN